MSFLTTTSRPAKDEVWQNPEIFSRIENLLEIESLTAPAWPSKDEILQNQEILIRVKNLAQNWDFWSGHAKDEIWQNSEIFSRVENLTQIMRVLTTPNQQRMKFGKIHKFLVVLKIWHKIWEFWTLRTCKGWNLAKSRNFQLRWKFGSNYESFDHSKPAKDEIWQNSQIFIRAENLAQNLRVLNTQDMRRMKFGKIQKFLVALKIWLKSWEFWPLQTSKGWNLAKFTNF